MTDRGAAHLAAVGEFDLLNSHTLEAAVRRVIVDGYASVLLDFSEVVFMDVSVVHALIRTWDVAAENGCIMRIVNPSPAAALILDASGTRTVLSSDQTPEHGRAAPALRQTILGRQPTAAEAREVAS